jgi:RimJ/RimL family protein N-acetyltransferase
MKQIIFETKHFVIRQNTLDDVQDYLLFWNDNETMKYIGDGTWGGGEDVVREVLRKNIAFYETHPGLGSWVVEDKASKRVVGETSLGIIRGTGEIEAGYILCREYWGKGLGTELLLGLLNYGFSVLKLDHIVAVTNPENSASIRVIEKCGMSYVGQIFYDNVRVSKYTKASDQPR